MDQVLLGSAAPGTATVVVVLAPSTRDVGSHVALPSISRGPIVTYADPYQALAEGRHNDIVGRENNSPAIQIRL